MFASKTPILLVHLIGLCLSVGPVLLLDIRLSRLFLGVPVRRQDIDLVALLSPWIRIGLLMLWISGAGFLLFYALNGPDALANPKLHAKLVVVVLLTLNGILVERYVFGQLAAREGLPLLAADDVGQRLSLVAIGAVSVASWYTPLLLGAVRELNFACSAWTILDGYGLAVAGVFAAALAASRLPRRLRAAVSLAGDGAVRTSPSL